jgi:hypothetical protein
MFLQMDNADMLLQVKLTGVLFHAAFHRAAEKLDFKQLNAFHFI